MPNILFIPLNLVIGQVKGQVIHYNIKNNKEKSIFLNI